MLYHKKKHFTPNLIFLGPFWVILLIQICKNAFAQPLFFATKSRIMSQTFKRDELSNLIKFIHWIKLTSKHSCQPKLHKLFWMPYQSSSREIHKFCKMCSLMLLLLSSFQTHDNKNLHNVPYKAVCDEHLI